MSAARPGPLVLTALAPRAARAALSLAGVGGAALLVLVLLGARRSLETGVRTVVEETRVDLWIAPRGTDNFVRASGSVSAEAAEAARAAAGVARADPLTRAFLP